MKKIFLIIFIGVSNLGFAKETAENNLSRDIFVKELVITLIKTQAAHISTLDHVETAYKAWEKYQKLANHKE